MKNYTILLIGILLLGASNAYCQLNNAYFQRLNSVTVESDSLVSWKQFGPGNSGYCEIVEYHPTDPNCIMMCPDMFNTYGSWDNGATWQTVKDADGNGSDMKRMRDYSFSHQDPDFGLALDNTGKLWETHDRGRSWKSAGSFDKGKCSVVEIDPTNDRHVYIGGGDFWNVKKNKRTYAQAHNVVMSGTEYGKIWRSLDGGRNWSLRNIGLHEDADVARIWVHPAYPETIYAGTSYGIYQSSNRGDTWVNIGTALPHNMIRDMACHYDSITQTTSIYVIDQVFWEPDGNGSIKSTGGVYRTTDHGSSWENLNANLFMDFTSISTFVMDYYYKKLAFWFGLSEDQAKADYPRRPHAILQNFNRLLIDPSNPSRLYLGHSLRHDNSIYPGDLWMTEDAGREWTCVARIGKNWQGSDRNFWESRGNPVNSNMQFAHIAQNLKEDAYPWLGCRALSISSTGDVTGVFEQQTLQSKNHGLSWQQIDDIETETGSEHWVGTGSSNLPGRQIIMDPRMPGSYFFLSGEHGLWKMQNDGDKVWPGASSFRQVEGQVNGDGGAHSIATMAIHPLDTNIMYILMFRQEYAGQVRRTLDGGQNWENITPAGIPIKTPDGTIPNTDWNRRAHQYSLIIDQENPDNMYFCFPSWVLNDVGDHRDYVTTQFGVHRSTDGGYTWTRQNNGIIHDPEDSEDYAVNHLCFDPDDSKTLYAAVMRSYHGNDVGGLYVTHDSADTWSSLSIPSEVVSVNHVHVDSLSGKIYIGCGYKKSSANSGGVWVSSDKGESWQKIFEMPLVFKVRTAPYDSGRIAVIAGPANNIGSINPGCYISLDNGATWAKSNLGLGQPDRVKDLHFDMHDPNLLWSSLWGSAWYKGNLKNGLIAQAENRVAEEGDTITLSAENSTGDIASYHWDLTGEIEATGIDQVSLSMVLPQVTKDSTIRISLHVSDGVNNDSTFVRVFVRNKKLLARFFLLDAKSEKAISDAELIINEQSYFTNPAGSLYLEDITPGNFQLSIKSENFEAYPSQEFHIYNDTTIAYYLEPKIYHSCIKVQDFNTGKAIEGSQVIIDGEEFLSNSQGLVCTDMYYGPHRLEIMTPGYHDFLGDVIVRTDSTIQLELNKELADLTFRIYHQLQLIEDVSITIGDSSKLTNSSGEAYFHSLATTEEIYYTIDKTGYEMLNSSLVLYADTIIKVNIQEEVLGLENITERARIFPNPAANFMWLNGFETGSNVRVFGISGNLLKEEKVESDQHLLNLSELFGGTYLLKINGNMKKLIILDHYN